MVLFDARWVGQHGIGRFARELTARLPPHAHVSGGPPLLSPLDPLWLSFHIARRKPDVYFSPGFNPPVFCRSPLVFTIHDLIHLQIAEESSFAKRTYFKQVVKPAARRARKIITVSEYSRREIVKWCRVDESDVVVAGNGVDPAYCPDGPRAEFGSPYLVYVGNRKPHKNLDRLFNAFAKVERGDLRLVLSGPRDATIVSRVVAAGIEHRVIFAGHLPEGDLPSLYRGAEALVLPSILEGFGLPALEAMACGTPVIASRSGSLPEVVGEAARLVDPFDVDDIRKAIDDVLADPSLRANMRRRGLQRAARYSWQSVADRVNGALRSAAGRST